MTFLTRIADAPRKNSHPCCVVRCVCGAEKVVREEHLKRLKSCGCKRRELIGNATRHHGMSHTRTHICWRVESFSGAVTPIAKATRIMVAEE